MLFRGLFLFILASGPLSCQVLRLGVDGGEPFGNVFLPGRYAGHFGAADYTSKPVKYTLGPSGEFGSANLSVEASALYQRFHYSDSGFSVTTNLTTFSAKTTGNAWSFPILLKWRPLRRHPVYFVGGPVMRHLSGLLQVADQTLHFGPADRPTTSSTSSPAELRKRWYPGLALGGGCNFDFSNIRISPEIRYTRWTANVAEDGANRILQFPPSRLELLIAITYKIF